MNTKLMGLALGLGLLSMAAQAQILTTLDDPGQAVGGNQFPGFPGVTGTPPGFTDADLAAYSGPGGSSSGGGPVGSPVGAIGNGAGSPPPPVPEPETYAMLMAGLGMVLVVARAGRRGSIDPSPGSRQPASRTGPAGTGLRRRGCPRGAGR